MKRMLAPLFNALAAPGLGNPHTPYEAELMAAGVKPVAIMSADDVTPDMQAALDAGRIVMIEEVSRTRIERIYCQPADLATARMAADRLEEACRTHEITADTIRLCNNFFEQPVPEDRQDNDGHEGYKGDGETGPAARTPSARNHFVTRRAYELGAQIHRHGNAPEIGQLLDGHIRALPPLYPETRNPAIAALESAVAEGDLAATDVHYPMLIRVFAQSARAGEGRELAARYYHGGAGCAPLDDVDSARRVGQLLGFTENDTHWFLGTKYQNPLMEKVMTATAGLRRWARKESMLLRAPSDPS